MRALRAWIHLAWTVFLTVALLVAALAIVPGTTVGVQVRQLMYVLVVPWLIALLAIRPSKLWSALCATAGGSVREGLATARVLELVGGLTIAAGAIGAIGSFVSFAQSWLSIANVGQSEIMHRIFLGQEACWLMGAVAAALVPPALALIWRLFLYRSVARSLRQRFAPDNTDHVGAFRSLKTGAVFAAGAILAILALVWAPELLWLVVEKPGETVYDTSMDVVYTKAGDQAARPETANPSTDTELPGVKPIRIDLVSSGERWQCLVDGETLLARLGHADEIYEQLYRMQTDDVRRPVEIRVAPEVSMRSVVHVMDACIRVRHDLARGVANASFPAFRIVVPVEHPPGLVQQLRLVRDHKDKEWERVLLQLPASTTAEPPVPEE